MVSDCPCHRYADKATGHFLNCIQKPAVPMLKAAGFQVSKRCLKQSGRQGQFGEDRLIQTGRLEPQTRQNVQSWTK
jgi:hypothetical protein